MARRGSGEVYRLYDADDRLLYVGMAGCYVERLRVHSHRPPRGKTWWVDVAYCTLEWFPDYYDALVAELAAIKAERPLHNKRGALCGA